MYHVRSGGAGVLHFRSCADGRGFPPRGCVVGTRSRCAVSRSLWRRQPIALRSLRFCGNNLGVLGDLCGYPRGLRLRATIRQFLRELRRIPSSAHRAFGGRLPPASPAAMRRLVAASPRWVICEICGSGSRTQDRESCHRAAKPANAPTGSGGAFRRYGIPDSAGRHLPKKGRVGQNLTQLNGSDHATPGWMDRCPRPTETHFARISQIETPRGGHQTSVPQSLRFPAL